MRLALGLQYNCTTHAGWQKQPHGNTIQNFLEQAILKFLGKNEKNLPKIISASRTDAGVHALGQVVHFDIDILRSENSWTKGINHYLPRTIVVCWAKLVPEHFHARFHAIKRTYCYALFIGETSKISPLIRGIAGYLISDQCLNIHAMQIAANYLCDRHDFSAFRSSTCQSQTPIRTLYQLDIFCENNWIYFIIRGDAFLQHMVRNIIGTLLIIGKNKKKPDWILEVLISKDRRIAGETFMPDGLYLVEVTYPKHFNIPKPDFSSSILPKKLFEKNKFNSLL